MKPGLATLTSDKAKKIIEDFLKKSHFTFDGDHKLTYPVQLTHPGSSTKPEPQQQEKTTQRRINIKLPQSSDKQPFLIPHPNQRTHTPSKNTLCSTRRYQGLGAEKHAEIRPGTGRGAVCWASAMLFL